MDLYYVLQDFEEYYELKFQRKPVLVKRNPNYEDETARAGARGVRKPPTGGMLPKINNSASNNKISGASAANSSRVSRSSTHAGTAANTPKNGRKLGSASAAQQESLDSDFAIQGTLIK